MTTVSNVSTFEQLEFMEPGFKSQDVSRCFKMFEIAKCPDRQTVPSAPTVRPLKERVCRKALAAQLKQRSWPHATTQSFKAMPSDMSNLHIFNIQYSIFDI
jgi:hypothetical protein